MVGVACPLPETGLPIDDIFHSLINAAGLRCRGRSPKESCGAICMNVIFRPFNLPGDCKSIVHVVDKRDDRDH